MEQVWAESPTWDTFDQYPELQGYVKYFLSMLLLEANRKGDGWDAEEVVDVLRLMDASILDAREADLGMAVALDLELLTPTPHPTDQQRSVWVPTGAAWRLRDESLRACRDEVERNGSEYVEDDDYLGPASPTPEDFREVGA